MQVNDYSFVVQQTTQNERNSRHCIRTSLIHTPNDIHAAYNSPINNIYEKNNEQLQQKEDQLPQPIDMQVIDPSVSECSQRNIFSKHEFTSSEVGEIVKLLCGSTN